MGTPVDPFDSVFFLNIIQNDMERSDMYNNALHRFLHISIASQI